MSWVSTKQVFLNCPYADKDEAKELGARWCPGERKWFVNPGVSLRPFAKWLPRDMPRTPTKRTRDGDQMYTTPQKRQAVSHDGRPAVPDTPQKPPLITYLNTLYSEKDEVKGLGARWDNDKRKWYVPAGYPTAPFNKWLLPRDNLFGGGGGSGSGSGGGGGSTGGVLHSSQGSASQDSGHGMLSQGSTTQGIGSQASQGSDGGGGRQSDHAPDYTSEPDWSNEYESLAEWTDKYISSHMGRGEGGYCWEWLEDPENCYGCTYKHAYPPSWAANQKSNHQIWANAVGSQADANVG
ncbi:hypothetical protein JKP88DRAFT_262070 [Tribonema minus]|uniref:DUF5710 domain-containing protein n=1 Tax=Tribonema minus TaxID=303371 RepID=A0A835Z9K1_9STRA|nr:hypothetical protein JKP88DRAFT_262070 [Tribonema minus]